MHNAVVARTFDLQSTLSAGVMRATTCGPFTYIEMHKHVIHSHFVLGNRRGNVSVSCPSIPAGFAKSSDCLAVPQNLKTSRVLADAFDRTVKVRGLAVEREYVGEEEIRYAALLKVGNQRLLRS